MHQPDRPIHLGVTGVACSGKTTLADTLSPRIRVVAENDPLGSIWWEHVAMGTPFHELVNILQTTEGENRENRVLYAVHTVLAELLPPTGSDVSYWNLTELVKGLAKWHLEGDAKPRAFMQSVSSQVRELAPNCLIDSTIRRMRLAEAQFNKDMEEREDKNPDKPIPLLGIVVSDVRIADQCGMIKDQPNHLMIKLTAPEPVLRDRAIDLGYPLGIEGHDTESWPATAPDEIFDAIYDTSEMSPPEICMDIYQHINKMIGE